MVSGLAASHSLPQGSAARICASPLKSAYFHHVSGRTFDGHCPMHLWRPQTDICRTAAIDRAVSLFGLSAKNGCALQRQRVLLCRLRRDFRSVCGIRSRGRQRGQGANALLPSMRFYRFLEGRGSSILDRGGDRLICRPDIRTTCPFGARTVEAQVGAARRKGAAFQGPCHRPRLVTMTPHTTGKRWGCGALLRASCPIDVTPGFGSTAGTCGSPSRARAAPDAQDTIRPAA